MSLAACDERPAPAAASDRLIVETTDGLAVVDSTTGRATVPAGPSVVTGDWTRLVRTDWTGKGTRLATHELPGGEVVAGGTLRDRLEARVVSPDGRLVALASPKGPRSRTTVVVADSSGERVRVDLPGNLEPEAFDATGQFLFVLDYLPPTAPDRYRVRAIDLGARALQPLLTRTKSVVPAGAEEEMRGQGRQSVYDPVRGQLFTLYTHQPDHLHTRDLLAGARDSAPHVHAFVHTLHLTERWAYCIDLPEPFGARAAEGHAIALSESGNRLCVVDATTATLATIDPTALNVVSVRPLPAPLDTGAATALLTNDGGTLVAGAGTKVLVSPLSGSPTRWSTPTAVRGLALAGPRVYVGQDGAVTAHELTNGQLLGRTPVPNLVAVRHVIPHP
ncbi:hypothetical protein GCM10023263_11060 [Phytohabitans rumicis]